FSSRRPTSQIVLGQIRFQYPAPILFPDPDFQAWRKLSHFMGSASFNKRLYFIMTGSKPIKDLEVLPNNYTDRIIGLYHFRFGRTVKCIPELLHVGQRS